MVTLSVCIHDDMQGHGGEVTSVSFSPDGRLIASGSDDKTVRICSVADGALVQELKVRWLGRRWMDGWMGQRGVR